VISDTAMGVRTQSIPGYLPFIRQKGTTLWYRLERKSSVAIVIYDQTGRMLFRSAGILREPGMHSMNFNRTSGIYYYCFSTDTQGTVARSYGRFLIMR